MVDINLLGQKIKKIDTLPPEVNITELILPEGAFDEQYNLKGTVPAGKQWSVILKVIVTDHVDEDE